MRDEFQLKQGKKASVCCLNNSSDSFAHSLVHVHYFSWIKYTGRGEKVKRTRQRKEKEKEKLNEMRLCLSIFFLHSKSDNHGTMHFHSVRNKVRKTKQKQKLKEKDTSKQTERRQKKKPLQ